MTIEAFENLGPRRQSEGGTETSYRALVSSQRSHGLNSDAGNSAGHDCLAATEIMAADYFACGASRAKFTGRRSAWF